MKGREAMAVPSTTSITTMPARLGMPAGWGAGGSRGRCRWLCRARSVPWALGLGDTQRLLTCQSCCVHSNSATHRMADQHSGRGVCGWAALSLSLLFR